MKHASSLSHRSVVLLMFSGLLVMAATPVFAATAGGSVDGNHIDVFVGPARRSPFGFVKSHAGATVAAYIVAKPEIAAYLHAAHGRPEGADLTLTER